MTNHLLTVLVNDNYHYQDEDERYQLGGFESLIDAIAACKRLVVGAGYEVSHMPGLP